MTGAAPPHRDEPGAAPDPFGTGAIREATLLAWTTSPTRFREDANLEEDHARGYYRDRVLVELAQNAADAAALDGAPGRLLLRLEAAADGAAVLTVANTGRALDRGGVLALASMRASAKPADADDGPSRRPVGRFGVGFAAVRAVSDEITVAGTGGGVRFSASAARALLSDALDAALRRDVADAERVPHARPSTTIGRALDRPVSALPLLRLPFPADALAVPAGYDTAVVARLRGSRERELVGRLLAEVDDVLLLALPALASVRIEVDGEPPRVLAAIEERWTTARTEGRHDPADLADRPFEERTRSGWSVTWAVPRAEVAAEPRVTPGHVLHAPTPTDEPCSLPAVLVATFPLDPSRRHVAPGAATDALLEHAGASYADLVETLVAQARDPLPFVPVGLGLGRLDAQLREHALAALRRRRILAPVAGDPDGLLSPREAHVVLGALGHDRHALAVLAPMLPGLVALPPGPEALTRLRTLGVEPLELADAVEALPATGEPSTWRSVYEAFARHVGEPGVVDALAALPVPLADGRIVRGPRGLVVLDDAGHLGDAAADLAEWGLRVVHPEAAHPLLARLGASQATGRTLLAHPSVRAAVRAADAGDGAAADAVLALVSAVLDEGATPEWLAAEHAWLALLPLPDEDGTERPAGDLVLPGSWAARVLTGLAPVADEVVDRHGPGALAAVGVRVGLTVVRVADVVAEPPLATGEEGTAPESALEGWEDYLEELARRFPTGTYLGELTAVADLDVVGDDAWPEVLARLASEPGLRSALLDEVRGDGLEAPSYTAWWLRDLFAAPFAAPGADVPFLGPVPDDVAAADGLDPAVLAALGAVGDLAGLDAVAWARYLDALPPVGTEVPLETALSVWRGLATAARAAGGSRPGPGGPFLPERLPVLRSETDGGPARAVIADATDAAVAAEPMWAQLRDVVPAPPGVAAAVAGLLGLPQVSDDVDLRGDGGTVPTPAVVLALLPRAPRTWWEHEDLQVAGRQVAWWVRSVPDGSGPEVHAATTAGLARAFAQAANRWEARAAVELVLADPTRADELTRESAWDGSGH